MLKKLISLGISLGIIYLIMGFTFLPPSKPNATDSKTLFPISPPASKIIHTFDLDKLTTDKDRGMRLALISLQGIVNRSQPQIYLYSTYADTRKNSYIIDIYKQNGHINRELTYENPIDLINAFKKFARGVVVVDPKKLYTINVATNVAAAENLIIVFPENIQALNLKIKYDLRDMFQSEYLAYLWVFKNFWNKLNHDMIGVSYYAFPQDYERDYYISSKSLNIWLPKKDDPTYSAELSNLVKFIMYHLPANIPVFGFWGAGDADGTLRGIGEYWGVITGGKFGKFTAVNDWAGNWSFHTGIRVEQDVFRQRKPRAKVFRTYDPTKKYIALTYMESYDSPGYWQFGAKFFQWDDKERGQVPISYGIAPSARVLAPGLLEWFYKNATENDYFFSAVSGMGYMNPLEGYGDYGILNRNNAQTMNKAAVLKNYYVRTQAEMEKMDLDMMGVCSHPNFTAWKSEDDDVLNSHVIPYLDGVSAIIAEIGRNDTINASNANRILTEGMPIHHTLTRWKTIENDFYPPTDTTKDEAAVTWLVNEITEQGNKGANFIQAMAYSWNYGPRRLKMVMEQLQSKGYIFMTLNEFNHVWRIASGLPTASRDPYNYFAEKILPDNVSTISNFKAQATDSNVNSNNVNGWMTNSEGKTLASITYYWSKPTAINKIILRDRAHKSDTITTGILEFSDGSSLNVTTLPNSGRKQIVEFPQKDLKWARFRILTASPTTHASGLAEFSAYRSQF